MRSEGVPKRPSATMYCDMAIVECEISASVMTVADDMPASSEVQS